nr:hypothetical protein [Tanacetum cinerariifolium]
MIFLLKDMDQDSAHMVVASKVPILKPALVSCDGLSGYDWSDQAEEGPNYALMDFLSSISNSEVVRKNDDALIIEEYVSDNEEENVFQSKIEKKTVRPSIAKIDNKRKRQEKLLNKLSNIGKTITVLEALKEIGTIWVLVYARVSGRVILGVVGVVEKREEWGDSGVA